jgi:hypothetical protein
MLRFVVPGNIANTRRDYHLLYGVFRKLYETFNGLFELTLLGRPSNTTQDHEIYSNFLGLQAQGYTINLFDDYVPDALFHNILSESDLLISPLKEWIFFNGVREYYTRSKGSGAISDGIRSCKPLLLPSHCQIETTLNRAILTHEDDISLHNILSQFIQNHFSLDEFKKRASKCYKHFSLQNCQKTASSIIDEMMKDGRI